MMQKILHENIKCGEFFTYYGILYVKGRVNNEYPQKLTGKQRGLRNYCMYFKLVTPVEAFFEMRAK
ncbi:MAG TPA: hypothetical protein ENH82_06945 [bacterium]|nr:hypothetical protein [bacterium]